MIYLQLAEYKILDQPELTNLTSNDNPNTANDTVIEECINLAERIVDMYIGISYTISDIRTYVLLPAYSGLKDILSRFTFVIARYNLYSRKNAVNSGSNVEKEYEIVLEMLREVRDGKAKLPDISIYVNRKTYDSTKDSAVLNTTGFKDFGNYETNKQY
jgi:phage gp36-like protein